MTLDVWIDKMTARATTSTASSAGARGEEEENEGSKETGPRTTFYNEFAANPPEQPRTWELENTGICLSNSILFIFSSPYSPSRSLPLIPSSSSIMLISL